MENSKSEGMSLPMLGMIIMAVTGAIVVGLGCKIINYWPLPASVIPYFGGKIGACWGLVVGAATGLFVGFIANEANYPDQNKS